jgi:hypothetical protein
MQKLSLLLLACALVSCAPREVDIVLDAPLPASFHPSSSAPMEGYAGPADQAHPSEAAGSSVAPASMRIDVPFAPQAPFADWGFPYQEACEEASVIMVHHYLKGSDLTLEQADKEIVDLVAWETANGYGEDVTIDELARIIREYYGYSPIVEHDVTAKRIKKYLQQGYPVVVPVAGREIGNPYFSGEGPFYHMLVIVGYDGDSFITNDPGTRRGEGYRYDQDVLLNAVHDWTGVKEEIRKGQKVLLVLMQG